MDCHDGKINNPAANLWCSRSSYDVYEHFQHLTNCPILLQRIAQSGRHLGFSRHQSRPAARPPSATSPMIPNALLHSLVLQNDHQSLQKAKEQAVARTRTWDLSHLMSCDSPKRES